MESLDLKKCLDELLDLGKKNRLLYLKPTSSILPVEKNLNVNAFLSELSSNTAFSIFDLDSYQRQLGFTNEDLNQAEKRNSFFSQAKKNFEDSEDDHELLVLPKKYGLFSALKKIIATSNESLEERGINVLYLTLGTLTWEDEDGEMVESPLLLFPISIARKGNTKQYELKYIEGEEIQVNTTLAYKLKQEYGVEIPELEPEYDFDLYQELLGIEISSYPNWKIKTDSYLGLFAFSKIDMYYDLENHEVEALNNPVVRKLFHLPALTLEEPIEGKEYPLHNVIDADSSQNQAVLASKQGLSFVLEGPPGTGKSQTITNIIAEALYDKKNVLFVSEKKAALDVVLHKLQQVGLDDYCLPLHGSKANKKEVINEICRILRMDKTYATEDSKRKLEDLKGEEGVLNQYQKVSGEFLAPLNLSYYQVLGKASYYENTPAPFFLFDDITSKDEKYHSDATSNLTEIQNILSHYGKDLLSYPYYGLKKEKYQYEEKISLQILLSTLTDKIQEVREKSLTLIPYMHSGNSIAGMKKSLNSLSLLASMEFYNSAFFDKKKHKEFLSLFDEIENRIQVRNEKREEALKASNPDGLKKINASAQLKEFQEKYSSFMRFFKPSYHKEIKYLKQFVTSEEKFNYEKALTFLNTISTYQQAKEDMLLSFSHFNSLLDQESFINEENLKEAKSSFEKVLKIEEEDYFQERKSEVEYELYLDEIKKVTLKEEDLKEIEELATYFEDGEILSLDLESLSKKVELMKNSFDSFDINKQLFYALDKAKENHYDKFILSYLKEDYPLENILSAFHKCFYTQWAEYLLKKEDTLSRFVRPNNENTISYFIQDDQLSFKVHQAMVKEACSNRIPPIFLGQNNIVSLLLQESLKKRNLPSIRALMNKYGFLVRRIKACFMMSPLTVSTFLGDNMRFDLVVFDEASQVFPWDAIGAIYRAKQVIIVGDNKQMPPTSFFLTGSGDDETENEELNSDISSYESILDFASSFPHYRLLWHYRSKTEDLISFSNEHFYNSSLITFPSALMKKEGLGVDYIPVVGAVYNRKTRANDLEAERIVDLIKEDYQKYPDQSLGVVVMNIAQQEKVIDLLEERCQKDPELNARLSDKTKEPLFIKNLETVQGDERDRIILSIGYSKDEEGKLYHNFGPLNRQGGERRLNVAITRAKINVQVVSSIHSYDIQEDRITSVGPKLLKDYLAYAEQKEEIKIKENEKEKDSVLSDLIADYLVDQGFAVKRNLGNSEYRIDIAVVYPGKEEYLLAIECDGYNYHQIPVARDRERLRKQILESQGWHYYRIFSSDYFLHPKQEKERLLQTIGNILEKKEQQEIQEQEDYRFERKEENKPVLIEGFFQPYQSYPVAIAENQIGSNAIDEIYRLFDRELERIVRKEGPICKSRLLKYFAYLSGRRMVSSVVSDAANQVLHNDHHPNVCVSDEKDNPYYWMKDQSDFSLRIGNQRALEEIPDIEIENGLFRIVELETMLKLEDLYHTFCYLIGYKKSSKEAASKLKVFIDKLVEENRLEINQDGFVMVKRY